MFYLSTIIGVVGAILILSPVLLKFIPSSKLMIEKIEPYSNWVGLVILGWGAWEIVGCMRSLSLIDGNMLIWILWLLIGLTDLFVGLMLSNKFLLRRATKESMSLDNRALLLRAPLGVLSIIMNVIYLIFMI